MHYILGDLLCTEAPDPNVQMLPSPNQLRRKILLKAKRQTTSEDATASLASEPLLQPRLNEASTPLLSEETTTPTPTHEPSSKSLKLKKMHSTSRTRTTSLPCKTIKHDKHEHGKGDDEA